MLYKIFDRALEGKTKLDLSNLDIQAKNMKYIAQALKTSKITDLDLNWNQVVHEHESIMYLANALKDTEITRLNIKNCSLLGNVGLNYFIDALKVTKITDLILSNISVENLTYLARILKDTQIKHLWLVLGFDSSGGSLECLTDVLKDTEITLLHLSNIRDESVQYIVNVLKDTQINDLGLTFDRIDNSNSIKYLADVLKDIQITRLSISRSSKYNEDESVEYFFNILKGTKITDLNLSLFHTRHDNCHLIRSLFDVLKDTQISRLSLSININDENISHLAKVLKETQIVDLSLRNCDISYNGLKHLADILKDTKFCKLTLVINNCNKLNYKVIKHLAKVLRNTQITYLDVTMNEISANTAAYMNNKLNSTTIETLKLHVYLLDQRLNLMMPIINQKSYRNTKTRHYISIANFDDFDIKDCIYYFQKSFKSSEIYELDFRFLITEHNVQYFSKAFKNIVIHNLIICQDIWETGKYVAQAFKGSRITALRVEKPLSQSGFKQFVEFLKKVSVLILDICLCNIDEENMSLLSRAVENNVIELNLNCNNLNCEHLKHLSQVLPNSKIMFLNLKYNCIGKEGIRYLANGLRFSQVKYINLDKIDNENAYEPLLNAIEDSNLSCIEICHDGGTFVKFERETTSIAQELCNNFQAVVSFNSTNEFEFILPENEPISFYKHIYLIKTLREWLNRKVHIYDMFCRCKDNKSIFDHNMIEKVDEFILAMPQKFDKFFNDILPNSLESLATDTKRCIKIVRQLDEAGYDEMVQTLLLHRPLYYIDENQEILHPFIYKMLDKHNMLLYSDKVEPEKREKIISYYRDHPGIASGKDVLDFFIVDFQRIKSCDN